MSGVTEIETSVTPAAGNEIRACSDGVSFERFNRGVGHTLSRNYGRNRGFEVESDNRQLAATRSTDYQFSVVPAFDLRRYLEGEVFRLACPARDRYVGGTKFLVRRRDDQIRAINSDGGEGELRVFQNDVLFASL